MNGRSALVRAGAFIKSVSFITVNERYSMEAGSLLIYSGASVRSGTFERTERRAPSEKATFVLERVRTNLERKLVVVVTLTTRTFVRSRHNRSQRRAFSTFPQNLPASLPDRAAVARPRAARCTRPQWNLGARRVLPLRN